MMDERADEEELRYFSFMCLEVIPALFWSNLAYIFFFCSLRIRKQAEDIQLETSSRDTVPLAKGEPLPREVMPLFLFRASVHGRVDNWT